MSSRGAEWIDDLGSREQSPNGPEGSSDKRSSKKRKVLSCYACRNRKMKCDRVYPVCGRCQKSGRADECTYDPRLFEEPHLNGLSHLETHGVSQNHSRHNPADHDLDIAPSDALKYQVRMQQRRIELLEQKLATRNETRTLSDYHISSTNEPVLPEEMMFRGKGFKTQYRGPTSIMSLVAQFRELQVFTRETLTVDHSIMRMKSDFKTFRDRRKVLVKEKGASIIGRDEEIFEALPEKSVLDVQAALYFQNWETTYRTLHEPSFWEEYRHFWEQRPNNIGQVGFAVVLLLVYAIAKCVTPKDDVFVGDMTTDRQTASDLINLCGAWNSRQPRKRLTLLFFQIQCLLLLAKRVNCLYLKQDWVTSGDLLRMALGAGMHRDPSLLAIGKISEFEKEMKKRLWWTIAELELISSIEEGIQSSLTGLYFDTPAPTNLPDDAFSIETLEMPAGRPVDSFTTTSYLLASAESLSLRVHLNQLLNDPSSEIRYADVLHYDSQLNSAISSLPHWGGNRATTPTALLHLQLQQFLLMLHRPYAKLAAQQDRFTYSFTAVVSSSSSIITIHDELLAKGSLSLNNSRNDVVRVGLSLSDVAYNHCSKYGPVKVSTATNTTNGNDVANFTHTHDHFSNMPGSLHTPLWLTILPQSPYLSKTLCTTSVEILDRARQIFEQKVMRLGTGYMEYWLLSAAVGMLPAPPSLTAPAGFVENTSDDFVKRCRKALDFFTAMAFRVLKMQKDPGNSFASSLRDTIASVSPSEGRTPGQHLFQTGSSPSKDMTSQTSSLTQMPYPRTQRTDMGLGLEMFGGIKEPGGPFDALEDMQVDLSGWSFPDFWAFDLGGDF